MTQTPKKGAITLTRLKSVPFHYFLTSDRQQVDLAWGKAVAVLQISIYFVVELVSIFLSFFFLGQKICISTDKTKGVPLPTYLIL